MAAGVPPAGIEPPHRGADSEGHWHPRTAVRQVREGGGMSRKHTGIQTRHARSCATSADKTAKCNCDPSYRAEVYDKRAGTKIRKTFLVLDEAKAWRSDASGEV